jgi:hypothetical protein
MRDFIDSETSHAEMLMDAVDDGWRKVDDKHVCPNCVKAVRG